MAPSSTAARTASQTATKTALTLFLFVIVFTGLLSAAYLNTKPALEASAAAEKMKLVNEVLPAGDYDNNLLADARPLPPTPELGLDEETSLYLARRGPQVVAAVFEAQAADGYAGRIRLLIAIRANGQLAGVRVTQHKETPGLGDYVEPKRDKNKAAPWITQFTGLAYGSMSDHDWRVTKDGGHFAYHAGATVTPRAVVKAVGRAVRWAESQRASLFAASGVAP